MTGDSGDDPLMQISWACDAADTTSNHALVVEVDEHAKRGKARAVVGTVRQHRLREVIKVLEIVKLLIESPVENVFFIDDCTHSVDDDVVHVALEVHGQHEFARRGFVITHQKQTVAV